jgi:glutamate racemase
MEYIQASLHEIHSSLNAWNTFRPHCMEYIQASLHKIHSSLIACNTFKSHCMEYIQASFKIQSFILTYISHWAIQSILRFLINGCVPLFDTHMYVIKNNSHNGFVNFDYFEKVNLPTFSTGNSTLIKQC